ncbi:unnamed protein product [Adineta steineri]|uniref:Uncharacterized protein n=1 Tax=Adineta steineri TaxID=433720 RepID=A0A814TDY2_9BILA|nr:unnamed protein product [Adineta steineri]CAF1023733.1 unnamed protein product [Adineta steineri]CAF1159523.1 unnamed protein product [Adineta steineri]
MHRTLPDSDDQNDIPYVAQLHRAQPTDEYNTNNQKNSHYNTPRSIYDRRSNVNHRTDVNPRADERSENLRGPVYYHNEGNQNRTQLQYREVTQNAAVRDSLNGRFDAQERSVVTQNQAVDRRNNPVAQVQHVPTTNNTSNTVRHTIPGSNGRSIILDISISIGSGGRASQANVTTNNTRSISPMRSTALFDNVRTVDLDLRAPEHTAKISTDGNLRFSS